MYVILSLIITYMYNVCAWNLTGIGMWWCEMVSNPCARHHDGWILHVFTLQKCGFRVLAAHSLAWFNTFFLKTCKNTEFTRLKFEKSLDNIFLLSSTVAPYLSYTVLVALSLLSFSPSLRSSVFQGWPGGPWGKDVFTTSDWSSGTLSLCQAFFFTLLSQNWKPTSSLFHKHITRNACICNVCVCYLYACLCAYADGGHRHACNYVCTCAHVFVSLCDEMCTSVSLYEHPGLLPDGAP